MEYIVKTIAHEGKCFDFSFEFDPSNEALTLFLLDDFPEFTAFYLSAIDKVLRGESKKEELTGNSSSVEFGPENTKIENLLPPDENESATCVVNTKELRQVMDEWLARRKEFREKQNAQKEGNK